MKLEQQYWTGSEGWQQESAGILDGDASLVLVFGATPLVGDAGRMDEVRARYPGAHLIGCSTSGEICGIRVRDDSLVVTAVRFEHTGLKLVHEVVGEGGDSLEAGKRLAQALPQQQLVHVFVLSDGLKVNGSELARGLREHLPEGVAVTGGLAGDGTAFQQTLVSADGAACEGVIAALGFYGERLKVGYGSLGGWDSFGAERLITRSKGNVLYELDGHSALELYKKYLGENNAGPAEALLFPLSLRSGEEGFGLVRTVMSINEEDQSMTFAGDMPEGGYARLMKANFDRLIDGAEGAAQASHEMLGSDEPELALLISCVGRKLVLKQRIEEEVEGVRNVLGKNTVLAGFYSYGEICPYGAITGCELHNQTMTITTFSER
ncbi:MAG: FIST C-terminal domain-containing protein [Gammaproteobacteria bacterium]|nr:FIST C-terminal domain-containing protein [Gammaproteobacteria bacterium]